MHRWRPTRRDFMKTVGLAGALGLTPRSLWADSGSGLVKPLPRQVRWQDYELGLVYHFDLDVYMPGGHHHERSRRERLDPALYRPAKLDTDQWLAAAQAAGARYAIFTATHHQAFSNGRATCIRLASSRSIGEGERVTSSPTSSRRVTNSTSRRGFISGSGSTRIGRSITIRSTAAKAVIRRSTPAICVCASRWSRSFAGATVPCGEIWFDGGVLTPEQGGPDVVPIVDRYQPDTIFYHSGQRAHHRWAGSEDGTAGYPSWATVPSVGGQIQAHQDAQKRQTWLRHGDPDGAAWCPAMADAPIREHDWLWIPGREDRVQPFDKLVDMYYRSVGHSANLMLGAVPDTDGLIPEADLTRYAELGREIRRRFEKRCCPDGRPRGFLGSDVVSADANRPRHHHGRYRTRRAGAQVRRGGIGAGQSMASTVRGHFHRPQTDSAIRRHRGGQGSAALD